MKVKITILFLFIILTSALIIFVSAGDAGQSRFFSAIPLFKNQQEDFSEIFIGSNSILVEIADSEVKRIKGLGGRYSLGENRGMLFIFEKPDFYSFWMKGMKFPLDFIWIRGDKVVGITEEVLPPRSENDTLTSFQSPEEADKVLEVNAGWIKKHSVKIGDKVSL